MPEGLIDLGSGVKMVGPSSFGGGGGGQGGLAGLTDVLQVVNLQNQISQAPLARQKLEAETKLKENEAQQIALTNSMQNMQLLKDIAAEKRAQTQFISDRLKDAVELFRVQPELGIGLMRQISPDITANLNEDGTASIKWQKQEVREVNGIKQVVKADDGIDITLDPNRVTPEKRKELELQWYSRFKEDDAVKKYGTMSTYYRILESSAQIGSGASDLAIVNAFAKMIQGGAGIVTEADVKNAMQTVGFTQAITNAVSKAWLSGGPIFGEQVPGITRTNFVDAAKIYRDIVKQDVLRLGLDTAQFARREGLEPRNVIAPVGDISETELIYTPDEIKDKLEQRAKELQAKAKPKGKADGG